MVEKYFHLQIRLSFFSNQGAFVNNFDSEGKTGESICDESCKKRNGLFTGKREPCEATLIRPKAILDIRVRSRSASAWRVSNLVQKDRILIQ